MRRRRLFGLLGAAALAAPAVALAVTEPGSVVLGDGPDDSLVVTGSEATQFVQARIGSDFYRISVYPS